MLENVVLFYSTPQDFTKLKVQVMYISYHYYFNSGSVGRCVCVGWCVSVVRLLVGEAETI